MSRGDQSELETIGIRTIIDLRSKEEIRRRRRMVASARYENIPFGCNREIEKQIKPLFYKKGTQKTLCEKYQWLYTTFVTEQQWNTKKIFGLLAEEDTYPVLIHCRAGKDRTGFISALLLLALGVDREIVFEDYLRTNVLLMPKVKIFIRQVKISTLGLFPTHNFEFMFSARRCFLEPALSVIDTEYGGIKKYLATCGISEECIGDLRRILVSN